MLQFLKKTSTPTKPSLLEQLRTALRTKYRNYHTEQIYILWLKKYISFQFRRCPKQRSTVAVNRLLSYLAIQGDR
jgi:hypothetical protein